MLRSVFLWLSDQPRVFEFLKGNRLGRSIASRFVAGETVETAVEAARACEARGIKTTLDLLGESVSSEDATHVARDEVLRTIDAMADGGLEANVSIKLTQLGLDISQSVCLANLRQILDRARERDAFIRIDMEDFNHADRTLALFHRDVIPSYKDNCGVVIQSYLRRSRQDVADLIASGARVRLCKGAYAESEEVAFQEKAEVDASYLTLMRSLVESGNYAAIATHDPAMIDPTIAFVKEHDIAVSRFEFQMLYGVRRDLQDSLRARGFNVRVYIPFGTAWYPYLMRRLAERPANVGFMMGSVAKELFSRNDRST
jgi:proline dehydrogenase